MNQSAQTFDQPDFWFNLTLDLILVCRVVGRNDELWWPIQGIYDEKLSQRSDTTNPMIFGNPQDFAIEAYHEPSGPQYGGYGRLFLFIQGVCLGDIRDNHCSLFHATDRIREVTDQIEWLWNARFADLSDAELFALLDREIYSGEAVQSGANDAACDFLTNTGEMFDGTKSFIIFRPPDRIHILYRLQEDTCGSGSCSVPVFGGVTDAYVRWFEEQVRTTGPPFHPHQPL